MENASSLLFAAPYSHSRNPISRRCSRIQKFLGFQQVTHAYLYITQYPRGSQASTHLQTHTCVCSKPQIFTLSVIRLQIASVSPGLASSRSHSLWPLQICYPHTLHLLCAGEADLSGLQLHSALPQASDKVRPMGSPAHYAGGLGHLICRPWPFRQSSSHGSVLLASKNHFLLLSPCL